MDKENFDLDNVRRKTIRLTQDGLVSAECLHPKSLLPLVIQPNELQINLETWVEDNRAFIELNLLKHGAILFRGFNIGTVEGFERFVRAVCGEAMQYRERSSPRSQVGENIYTSTDYPAGLSIFPHNEHSYSHTWPMKLFFYCKTPPSRGGETPVADTRRILKRISPQIVDRFVTKKWMYVRNFGEGVGLPWQSAFQTDDRALVEKYCREHDIEFEWRSEGRLKTRQIREAVRRHPESGELVWFNHATFFHHSTLDPSILRPLREQFAEEDLPNNTYYGDASPIEDWALDELREAYRQERVIFSWREGDLILLDNMLTAHAREPFAGPRMILFAMAEPFSYRNEGPH